MNKNPFLPQPSFTPQQPPLPPGPPPPPPGQPDYSAYWAAAAQQPHVQPPAVGPYNQWTAPQPPRPPAEQSALYANYGYGSQQNNHWRQQQQQQQQQQYHPQPVAQPPPAQPAYNPYQPTAGYPQQYLPQNVAPPQPISQPPYPHAQPQPQPQFFAPHMQGHQQQPRHLHHTPPQHLPPAKRQRFDGPNNRHPPSQHHQPPPQPQFQPPPPPPPQNIGPYTGQSHGPGRGGAPGAGHNQMSGGRGRSTGSQGGTGSGSRGGRGGSMSGRGGISARGRGSGGSGYGGGTGGGGRGGGAGQSGSQLRSQGSRGNFGGGKDYHNRRGGGSFVAGNNSGYQGSFASRGRNQGHSGSNRGGRHDGGSSTSFGVRDGAASSSFGSSGKKDENRRTFTDFKIIGLEIPDLAWSWGNLPNPTSDTIKEESLDSVPSEPQSKDDVMEDSTSSQTVDVSHPVKSEGSINGSELAATKSQHDPLSGGLSTRVSSDSPPLSRIRFYFHTPVTADDARPIPHNPTTYTEAPSDSRKGKRKKLEDDDGELEDSRTRPPPPQLSGAMSDDRSSVAASVAPSVAETASEGDWLMAAIVEGDEEAEAAHELDPENEDDDQVDGEYANKTGEHSGETAHIGDGNGDIDGHLHDDMDVNELVNNGALEQSEAAGDDEGNSATAGDTSLPPVIGAPTAGTNAESTSTVDNGNGKAAEAPVTTPEQHQGAIVSTVDISTVDEGSAFAPLEASDSVPIGSISPSQIDALLPSVSSVSVSVFKPISSSDLCVETSLYSEEHSTNHVGYLETQVVEVHHEESTPHRKLSDPTPTLLDIEAESTQVDDGLASVGDFSGDATVEPTQSTQRIEPEISEAEHLPEPPASPTSHTLPSTSSSSACQDTISLSPPKPDSKPIKIPSANRLSISYAGGNRRLVIDAEVVESLNLFRQEGRIEVVIGITKEADDGLKGILMEGLSEITKSYLPLPGISDVFLESDPTVPTFAKVAVSASMKLLVYLDTTRPLSEPKWAKTGDVQDWLKSMFGRMFWVSGDAAEGWEKKIHVVDPDPPPTIWTVLEGWAANSPGGVTERQRFLKTHMTETDNILEILLRLVRGERATPFSQNSSSISGANVSGPLLSALSQGSAHGAQQTHVSLAVLAMFRMSVEYAKKALGDKGKGEVEERVGEIIRCLPSHLIYKSLDGIFKEWRVEKKGR